jgi:hypothetical protein
MPAVQARQRRSRSAAIQAYLGHRNIQNTTRYTALAPQRFKEFFICGRSSARLLHDFKSGKLAKTYQDVA